MSTDSLSARPVVGFVAAGVSGAALIAVSARCLSPTEFRAVGLVWTGSTIFGVGLASPVEQFVARALSAGDRHVRGPLRALALAGLVTTTLLLAAANLRASWSPGSTVLLTSTVAVIGWCVVSPVRAVAAGEGRFDVYGAALIVEAVLRAFFLVIGWGVGGDPILLGLGVGAPMVVSAVYVVLALRRPVRSTLGGRSGWASDLGAFLAVSVGFQICLSAPVFFLDWASGQAGAEDVGQFVAANGYLRAPALLLGGLTVQGLSRLSKAWSTGDPGSVKAEDRLLVRRGTVVTAGGVGVAWLSVPLGLPLFIGRDPTIGGAVLGALAVSTGLGMLGALNVQRLLATRRTAHAAGVWVTAALVTCVGGITWASCATAPGLGFVAVLLAGPLVAFVLVRLARLAD